MKKRSSKSSILDNNFIKCGAFGLCLEVIWTALANSITTKNRKKNRSLCGKSSIIMFPIYGLACLILPFSKSRICNNKNVFFRGMLYSLSILSFEFLFGTILKKMKCCPWDYSKCKYNIKGLIRLDFIPIWFCVGLLYERLLSPSHKYINNSFSDCESVTNIAEENIILK